MGIFLKAPFMGMIFKIHFFAEGEKAEEHEVVDFNQIPFCSLISQKASGFVPWHLQRKLDKCEFLAKTFHFAKNANFSFESSSTFPRSLELRALFIQVPPQRDSFSQWVKGRPKNAQNVRSFCASQILLYFLKYLFY